MPDLAVSGGWGSVALAWTAQRVAAGGDAAGEDCFAELRKSVHPQREALDILRRSSSPVLSDTGRRRFSDVFDTASRAAQGLEAARTALAESLDAYRGAEARQATEVTRVLTVYAAIMLPLSLVAGFFGMNFVNLPLIDRSIRPRDPEAEPE